MNFHWVDSKPFVPKPRSHSNRLGGYRYWRLLVLLNSIFPFILACVLGWTAFLGAVLGLAILIGPGYLMLRRSRRWFRWICNGGILTMILQFVPICQLLAGILACILCGINPSPTARVQGILSNNFPNLPNPKTPIDDDQSSPPKNSVRFHSREITVHDLLLFANVTVFTGAIMIGLAGMIGKICFNVKWAIRRRRLKRKRPV